ncbi:hypothetical protein [Tenacibaculum mesophilum]|uniref:hypothetical protein n=1 Tax=Tenacibaculum mesophilum TaxID=104268 RepID=UPI000649C801|nr:hypothetical protein [Tenacibaculum mesophilum]
MKNKTKDSKKVVEKFKGENLSFNTPEQRKEANEALAVAKAKEKDEIAQGKKSIRLNPRTIVLR